MSMFGSNLRKLRELIGLYRKKEKAVFNEEKAPDPNVPMSFGQKDNSDNYLVSFRHDQFAITMALDATMQNFVKDIGSARSISRNIYLEPRTGKLDVPPVLGTA